MKKIFITVIAIVAISFATKASSYQLDENKMEQTFQQSEDISTNLLLNNSTTAAANQFYSSSFKGDQTVGGYLLRSFFCGGIALHRYYMGTSKKGLWAMYLCIPVAGGVAACVDFWWVVFSGEKAMNKYKDNSKYWVFAGK